MNKFFSKNLEKEFLSFISKQSLCCWGNNFDNMFWFVVCDVSAPHQMQSCAVNFDAKISI